MGGWDGARRNDEKEIQLCLCFCFGEGKKTRVVLKQWFSNFLVSGPLYILKSYLRTPKSFSLSER